MRVNILLGPALCLALLAGCGKNTSTAPPPEPGASPTAQSPAAQSPAEPAASAAADVSAATGAAAQAGGLTWNAPESWSAQPERPMRAATYQVPAAQGDAEPGECAVFYFGPNEGGGVQANIDRWIGQMKQPDGGNSATVAKTSKLQAGVPVTLVDLTGTYLASGGPMMQVQAEKPGYRLIGAIAEGAQGAIFFKFTGPEKTVAANQDAFLAMLKSVKPQ